MIFKTHAITRMSNALLGHPENLAPYCFWAVNSNGCTTLFLASPLLDLAYTIPESCFTLLKFNNYKDYLSWTTKKKNRSI